MKFKRSVISTKNRLINKKVKQLSETVLFLSYYNEVFSITNKAFIEKNEKETLY